MAQPNTQPRFTKVGRFGSVLIAAALTDSSGAGTIGTNIYKAFTADSTNGSYVDKVRFMATATTPTATNAGVLRVFLSSITSGTTTSADTFLIGETTVPAVNADNASAAVAPYDVPIGAAIPPGYTILVSQHMAVATNTNWRAVVFGGDY